MSGTSRLSCSICITVFDKPIWYLRKVLCSIQRQDLSGIDCEVVVVDDGRPDNDIETLCQDLEMARYVRIDREPVYRNKCAASNVSFKEARGDIIIKQDDDIEHQGEVIRGLICGLEYGEFTLASVYNVDPNTRSIVIDRYGRSSGLLTNTNRVSLNLAAIWRKDIYRVGGYDERFVKVGGDDVYLGNCLKNGLGLKVRILSHIVGHHLHHDQRYTNLEVRRMRRLRKGIEYKRKWVASGGPWPWKD